MKELLTTPQAETVTSGEIGLWLGRLHVVHTALDANHQATIGSDWGDDDARAGEWLASKSQAEGDWRKKDMYQVTKLYGMKAMLYYDDVDRVLEPARPGSQPDFTLGNIIEKTATREGLAELGLLEAVAPPDEATTFPIGLAAAFHFKRADISSPVDRSLYGRASEINASLADYKQKFHPRILKSKDGRTGKPYAMLAYTWLAWPKDAAVVLKKFGEDPARADVAWWDEVKRDLQSLETVKTQD